MKKIIRYYKEQPVTIKILDITPFAMFNGFDVAKILGTNFYEFLESDDAKQYQPIMKKNGKTQEQIIDVESSKEIFIHPLLFMRMTWDLDVEFYLWNFDVVDEARRAIALELEIN